MDKCYPDALTARTDLDGNAPLLAFAGWELQFESFSLHWQDIAQNREHWKGPREQFIQHFMTKRRVRNDSGRQAAQGPVEEGPLRSQTSAQLRLLLGWLSERAAGQLLQDSPWPFPRNRFPNWDFALTGPYLCAFDFDAPDTDPSIRSFHLIGLKLKHFLQAQICIAQCKWTARAARHSDRQRIGSTGMLAERDRYPLAR